MSFRGKEHELIIGVLMFHTSFHTFQDRARGPEERHGCSAQKIKGSLHICGGSICEDTFDEVICHPASVAEESTATSNYYMSWNPHRAARAKIGLLRHKHDVRAHHGIILDGALSWGGPADPPGGVYTAPVCVGGSPPSKFCSV